MTARAAPWTRMRGAGQHRDDLEGDPGGRHGPAGTPGARSTASRSGGRSSPRSPPKWCDTYMSTRRAASTGRVSRVRLPPTSTDQVKAGGAQQGHAGGAHGKGGGEHADQGRCRWATSTPRRASSQRSTASARPAGRATVGQVGGEEDASGDEVQPVGGGRAPRGRRSPGPRPAAAPRRWRRRGTAARGRGARGSRRGVRTPGRRRCGRRPATRLWVRSTPSSEPSTAR